MKLTGRLNFRLSGTERADFERCYQAWLAREQPKEDGRYAKARIWSRSSFAREIVRNEVRQLAALVDTPPKS